MSHAWIPLTLCWSFSQSALDEISSSRLSLPPRHAPTLLSSSPSSVVPSDGMIAVAHVCRLSWWSCVKTRRVDGGRSEGREFWWRRVVDVRRRKDGGKEEKKRTVESRRLSTIFCPLKHFREKPEPRTALLLYADALCNSFFPPSLYWNNSPWWKN